MNTDSCRAALPGSATLASARRKSAIVTNIPDNVNPARARKVFRKLVLVLTLLLHSVSAGQTAPPSAPTGFTLDTGTIEGATFAIARPAQWNGTLLLIAHGLRDDKAPLLPDLNPGQLAHRALLDQGWMVAKTSFRRNGMVIRDAIDDLENLRAHIEDTYGKPQQVVLEGDSMGGAIVTLIAEQFPEHYQGAIAVDVVLQTRKSKDPLTFNLQPQIPLVFLTNQSELKGPRKYVSAPFDQQHKALILEVRREGAGNVSQRERLVALRTLFDMIERQPIELPIIAGAPPMFDATVEPVPFTSAVRPLAEGGFEARVTEVDEIESTVVLNAQPSDFSAADIAPDTWFELVAKGQTYRASYGRSPASVKPGQWVAFPDADGFCELKQRPSRKPAASQTAASIPLKTGDPVVVHRLSGSAAAEVP